MIFLEIDENFYCRLCLSKYGYKIKRIDHENGHVDFEKSFVIFYHDPNINCIDNETNVKKVLGKYLVSRFND